MNMFSTGQKIFGVLFFIVFVGIIVYQYRKDIPLHKIYYPKTYQVLLAFFGFLLLLFTIKFWLK